MASGTSATRRRDRDAVTTVTSDLDGLARLYRRVDQLSVVDIDLRIFDRLLLGVVRRKTGRIFAFRFRALVRPDLRHLVRALGLVFSLSWFRHGTSSLSQAKQVPRFADVFAV